MHRSDQLISLRNFCQKFIVLNRRAVSINCTLPMNCTRIQPEAENLFSISQLLVLPAHKHLGFKFFFQGRVQTFSLISSTIQIYSLILFESNVVLELLQISSSKFRPKFCKADGAHNPQTKLLSFSLKSIPATNNIHVLQLDTSQTYFQLTKNCTSGSIIHRPYYPTYLIPYLDQVSVTNANNNNSSSSFMILLTCGSSLRAANAMLLGLNNGRHGGEILIHQRNERLHGQLLPLGASCIIQDSELMNH